MSKKKIQVPTNGTILQQFHEFLQENRKKSDIITFLSVISSRLSQNINNMTVELEYEVLEFTNYFMNEFYDLLYDEIMKKWGQDPFVIRLATAILHERYISERRLFIQNTPDLIRKEADTLFQTLFNIREDRIFSFYFGDEGDETEGMLELPKKIPKDKLQNAKDELLFICIILIKKNGFMSVHLLKDDHEEVFGIKTVLNGMWIPVGKDEMKKIYLTTPEGFELEPENNVVYTEIKREIF